MNSKIDLKIEQLKQIAKGKKVSSLYIFGSILTDEFNEIESDIDFLVTFEPEYFDGYSENYEALRGKLEELYKREIDLVSYKAIKNKYLLDEIDRTKILVYA